MGISHIALAVKDLEATHRFYTDVMGFDLNNKLGRRRTGTAGGATRYTLEPDVNVGTGGAPGKGLRRAGVPQ